MSSLGPFLVFVHVAADVVWIGSILAVAAIAASEGAEPAVRGRIARNVYRKLAAPSFGIAFITGVARLGLDPGYYFSATHFMHGKLTFALAVIALHHVIGARVKKMESSEVKDAGPISKLAAALFVCAVAAVFFVIVKPF